MSLTASVPGHAQMPCRHHQAPGELYLSSLLGNEQFLKAPKSLFQRLHSRSRTGCPPFSTGCPYFRTARKGYASPCSCLESLSDGNKFRVAWPPQPISKHIPCGPPTFLTQTLSLLVCVKNPWRRSLVGFSDTLVIKTTWTRPSCRAVALWSLRTTPPPPQCCYWSGTSLA
jgi:hypothetical protein